jgi:hypothetical protein
MRQGSGLYAPLDLWFIVAFSTINDDVKNISCNKGEDVVGEPY